MDRFLQIQIYNQSNTSVQYDNTVDTNWGIQTASAKLDKTILDSDLAFGELLSDMFQVQIFGINQDLSDRKIVVSVIEGSTPIKLFTGYIASSKTDYNSSYRDIVAYDRASKVRDRNVASFWNNYWTNNASTTLKAFRNALLQYVGITPVSRNLINDNLTIVNNFTNQLQKFAFDELLRLICEIQLCFPHFNADEELEFIKISTTAKTLSSTDYETNNSFWEDFTTANITGLGIYDSGSELAQVVGTNTNVFNISGNVFLLNKTASELNTIGTDLLNELSTIAYVPTELSMIVSDFSYELGDLITTGKGNMYVFNMELSGSLLINQTLRCYATDKYLAKNIVTHNSEILEGNKIAKIYHDIDELDVEYRNVTYNLANNYYNKTESDTNVNISAQGVLSTVSTTYETKTASNTKISQVESEISQQSQEIVLKVDSNDRMVLVELGVDADDSSATYFNVDANNIDLTASNIINILSDNTLNLSANNIDISSTNFNVDSDGNVRMQNANIQGAIQVAEGGKIGQFSIDRDGNVTIKTDKYKVTLAPDGIIFQSTVTGIVTKLAYDGLWMGEGKNLTQVIDKDRNINCKSITMINEDEEEPVSVLTSINTKHGAYSATFHGGEVSIPFSSFGLTSRPSNMILTPMSGGAIVLNYKYAESVNEIVIWGSDSSSWSSEDGGWLEDVTVDFSYIVFLPETGGTYVEGWIEDSIGWKYQLSDGSFLTSEWETIDGVDYYFNSNSYMASNEFSKASDYATSGNLYFMNTDGSKASGTYGWNSNASGSWIYQKDGSWVPYSYWARIDEYWYYFGADGYMVTGTVTINGIVYTFGEDGKLHE